jgi:hypothetical protein
LFGLKTEIYVIDVQSEELPDIASKPKAKKGKGKKGEVKKVPPIRIEVKTKEVKEKEEDGTVRKSPRANEY